MRSMQRPPVLAYILKGYPRISETFISNEILLLEQLGFTMRLFSMRRPRESFSHASVKRIKAQIHYLPTELLQEFFSLLRANIFLAGKQPRLYRTALRTAGEGLEGGGLATLKHLLQAGYLTNEHLLPTKDVVHLHGHFAHSPTSVTRFASILSGIPFSFTAHAKDIYTSDKEKLRRKIADARFVITCTRQNKEYLQDVAGDCSTPIYCIYHGIDLNLFKLSGLGHSTDTKMFKLLSVARITEKKGLSTVYRALALLRDAGIPFHHTLIGDGDDKEKILSLIQNLGLAGHCSCLGTQTHEEVLRQFRQSDLFVLGCEIAENGDRDGIPNVLVESLAMGVPALSTDVSAIPEILVNGETGITVRPREPQAMAEAMQRMLTDHALRQHLITCGKEYVQANFDNSLWIKQLAQIFRKHNASLQ